MIRLVTTIYFISLSVWVGGMIVLAFLVAPLTFKTLGSKTQAGELFGTFLHAFVYVDLACALTCTVTILVRTLRPGLHAPGPDGWSWAQLALLGGMVLVAAAHDLVVLPRARTARNEIRSFDTPPETPAEENARRGFRRLHTTSEFLFGLNMVLGLCLMGVSARTYLQ